eukprot:4953375-Alexandrium_andersonii.AAC.1
MGLLEVVPEPPEPPTRASNNPLPSERVHFTGSLSSNAAQNTNIKKRVNFKDPLNMEAARNGGLKHSVNSNLSGESPPSGRRLRAHSEGRRSGGPAPAGAAGLC